MPQQTAAQRDFPASVEEVVRSGCANQLGHHFFYSRELREKALEKLRLLDIEALRDKSYRTLSGGQQQRTLLARALCATEQLLLLDEPVTGLDPTATEELYAVIRKLNRSHGVSVVMVSHDLHSAVADANRVVVIDRGVRYVGDVAGCRDWLGAEGSH